MPSIHRDRPTGRPAPAVSARRTGRIAAAPRAHVGMLLAGWGAFNLVEGLVNHQLLGIHHLRDDLGAPPPTLPIG